AGIERLVQLRRSWSWVRLGLIRKGRGGILANGSFCRNVSRQSASRMRSWQRPFFLGRSLCGEQAFPQGLLVFSRPPEAACPFFAIFPPLLTFRGEALRWHLRCVLSPEGFPCTSTRPSRCSLGAVWTIAPPWPPSVTSSTPSPIRPYLRACGRP